MIRMLYLELHCHCFKLAIKIDMAREKYTVGNKFVSIISVYRYLICLVSLRLWHILLSHKNKHDYKSDLESTRNDPKV